MKVLKKVMSFVLAAMVVMVTAVNADAAEDFSVSSNYTPWEESGFDVLADVGTELQNGEKKVIGNYTIEYQEKVVCLTSYTNSSTKNYVSTSHYNITNNGNEQEWYKIEQTTNYTYNGRTVKINAASCNLNVTTYYPECSYTINKNTIDNSSNTAPTYTIGVTMKLSSKSITITDVVTAYADGTHSKTHYQ
ncbi:MAG: hypothetical protein K2M46_00835 [Lachnospiraceae bacterium]|nr:hypothetical protein [Lachnospiraceae bacterium]